MRSVLVFPTVLRTRPSPCLGRFLSLSASVATPGTGIPGPKRVWGVPWTSCHTLNYPHDNKKVVVV